MPPRRHRKPAHLARPPRPPAGSHSERGERLQKVLAAAGLGSRRQCEELILAGRVEVDRKVVVELGTRVDPERQQIRIDGETLKSGRRLYFAVNKPKGVVSTNQDPSGRPRVIDLVPAQGQRLFPIGRLDLSSEGLILVTNDGELADLLTHPRYGVEKTYVVQVAGEPTREVLTQLQQGIHLAEGVARAASVKVRGQRKQSTVLEVVLREGHNREIRRIMAKIGHKVLTLRRTAVGPVRLGTLPPGSARPLTRSEIDSLRRAARRPDRPEPHE